MTKRKFSLWVDGQRRNVDYPPEPPGYTPEQLERMYWLEVLAKQAQMQLPLLEPA